MGYWVDNKNEAEIEKFLSGEIGGVAVTEQRLMTAVKHCDPTRVLTGPDGKKRQIIDWVLKDKGQTFSGELTAAVQLRVFEIITACPARKNDFQKPQNFVERFIKLKEEQKMPDLQATAASALREADRVPAELLEIMGEYAGLGGAMNALIQVNDGRRREENKEEMERAGAHRGIPSQSSFVEQVNGKASSTPFSGKK